VAAIALALPCAAAAEWLLWPSPVRFAPDIEPAVSVPSKLVGDSRPAYAVGQTFVPRQLALMQLDLTLNHEYDQRPGLLRLWRWAGSYEATIAGVPLFSDVVDFSGYAGWQIRSFFPRIAVVPGETYFFEVSGTGRGRFSLLGDRGRADGYPHGRARVNGGFPQGGETWDLWFRTFSLPRLPEAPPPFPSAAPRDRLAWHPPLPESGRVTRDDYLARFVAFADLSRQSALAGCGDRSHADALLEALLYRISCARGSCNESYARNAVALLLRAHAWRFCLPPSSPPPSAACTRACDPEPTLGSTWLPPACTALRMIEGSPSLGQGSRARIGELIVDSARRAFLTREVGTHNRAVQGAAGFRLAAALFPGDPDASRWRAHAEEVWGELWGARDTEEDSGGYSSDVWWPAVLDYVEAAGLDGEVWSDPGFLSLLDRTFATTAPLGVPPDHGDSSGSLDSAAALVWLFERAAARTGEPRYRWLAHRLFEFNRSRARQDPPRAESLFQGIRHLARAYLDADERLAAAPPLPTAAASTVTMRTKASARPKEIWGETTSSRSYDLGPGRVPDKLVLRSGFGPEDLFAVFNLLAGYRHGQMEIGALVLLTDRGSLLSAPTPVPYWFHAPHAQDESAPLVRRYWGGRYHGPGTRSEVTRFEEARRATVAWVEWRDPNGWGVRIERRITFLKNRLLWIRDRFNFPDAIAAAVGPVWHSAGLLPEHGESWYDTFQREPVANVFKFRNPERYLLHYFVPREGYASGAFEEASYLPPADCPPVDSVEYIDARCRAGAPYVLYQRWTGDAQAGASLWFDTLLLPHGPELSPEEAAGAVRVLLADGERVALEVGIGGERWILAESPSGIPIAVSGLVTNARYLVLGTSPGQPGYLLARGASWIQSHGLLWRSPLPISVETELAP